MLEGDEYRRDERAAAGRQAAATEQIPEIDQNVVIKRGWAAYDGLRFQEAESCFGGLLHGSDASPIAAVCGLSAVKRALGRPSEAKCLVERARQYHVDDTFLRRELGYIAYDQRCFDGAASIVNIHVPGARDWRAGAVVRCGGVYGGSGMGGIQGLPARASWMAVRTWAPCLAAVEM